MRLLTLIALSFVASVSRCDGPNPRLPSPDPKPGDEVHIRGILDDDVDCRLLRADGGKVYSLSERLRNYRAGTRLCVHGTIAEVSQCIHGPTIDVSEIRPWSSCP
jgi:hypothetical protein